uniref:Ribonuclease H protein At1g65750 family n=1 Tax=Cajanus cajan TaxID=3821 RepID=A0A151QQ71_CAJCA|nr:Putative ribonuclease H protein At1g65750 family [Cajanus cajan]
MWGVTNSSLSVLWNGSKLPSFAPTRGLRQGDPLSPYLFVLCMERLALRINELNSEGCWNPIHLSPGGPPISHLLFANDVIFFSQATNDQVQVMASMLENFCTASGLKINLEKSKFVVSKGVPSARLEHLEETLSIEHTPRFKRYLEILMIQGKAKILDFHHVIDRINDRLAAWNGRLLNKAGRLYLINSVVTSIPLYSMQSIWLPQVVCNKINQASRTMLWAKAGSSRYWSLVGWNTVTRPKLNDLFIKNVSFNIKEKVGMIMGWLLWYRLHDIVTQIHPFVFVEYIIFVLIPVGYPIPSSPAGANMFSWEGDSSGCYTVASGFRFLLSPDHGLVDPIWKRVWKLHVLKKIKFLLWQGLHSSIPTNHFRSLRHLDSVGSCPRCSCPQETILHAIRDCPHSQEVWLQVGNTPSQIFSLMDCFTWFKGVITNSLWKENVKWSLPKYPWIKVNVDGSWLGQSRIMGVGGVVRDAVGRWKGGFARSFEDGDSLRAEILALAEGLSLCWNAGFRYIICESDCIGAVKAVQGPTLDRDNIHKHSDIIGAVKDLVARDWSVKIVNIPREINSVAHALAS